MAKTEVIQNGGFTQGAAGWSGNDIEASYPEDAYLGNGSSNVVAETDGNSGQTTVMEQSFTVDHALSTTLTFDTALRTSALGNAGVEGFTVEILDDQGNVIATRTVTPTGTDWTTVAVPVDFPAGGTYTLRFTEIGPDDSLGAIIDNVSLLVCFAEGTRIETPNGEIRVEDLRPGDLVSTVDEGPRPLLWIGSRHVSPEELSADARLRPVAIDAGALGPDQPSRQLRVSQQHRLCIGNWTTELHFGESQVLVPAAKLLGKPGVRLVDPPAGLTYFHLLFDRHQIVIADGAPAESFFPTDLSLRGLDMVSRLKLRALVPDPAAYGPTARTVIKDRQARLPA